jgi:predicted enzyme related to lactoylglutathione lyase
MKVIKTKIETRSLLLGAFAGALAVLCVAAATTKTDGDAALPQPESGDTTAKGREIQIEQVTGIGGVFFKAKDPKAMVAWYRQNLGIQSKGGYTDFTWRDHDHPDQIGHTAWRIFPTNTTYFGQSSSSLMINYRVANLDRMLEQLRRSGVKIEKVENYNYGRWAWITDPEGNRFELWEPKGK